MRHGQGQIRLSHGLLGSVNRSGECDGCTIAMPFSPLILGVNPEDALDCGTMQVVIIVSRIRRRVSGGGETHNGKRNLATGRRVALD